ncbi:MAG: glycerol kinase GlpK [Coriobacteriia bacterium]|nr:glycerol kinase GlpK [Coriobacteriia bacterium]MCL2749950.1 glycerol kinase GlpK [Coriobacteriia bacterium]
MPNSKDLILALDQGTTSSRAVIYDAQAEVLSVGQIAFQQHYPQPGWVEHDAMEILSSQLAAVTGALVGEGIDAARIRCIGITNQRETTVLWNRSTGLPIAPAIVWQCRRTTTMVDEITADPVIFERIREKTGLIPDAYFSASKIKWLLDNLPGAREQAESGELAFGTIDSWLIWHLTGGKSHATDYTNASRTMLFNIHEGCWDEWLLDLFEVPRQLLPEVRPSASLFGHTEHSSLPDGIPVCGVAGDQQAALFGQTCFEPGEAKNTFGTGCFLLVHTGNKAPLSENQLLTTIAASAPGSTQLEYALEGSVFVSGALIQWLRDELGLISSAAETEELARQVSDTGGVYIVPAFTGLGAPYWDMDARGAILGLTRGTTINHLARAALEAMAFELCDLVEAVEADISLKLKHLKVDGGASANDFLLQFQSDLLDAEIFRPQNRETTVLGAAFLAGLSSGLWKDTSKLKALVSGKDHATFTPVMPPEERKRHLDGWHRAVGRVLSNR